MQSVNLTQSVNAVQSSFSYASATAMLPMHVRHATVSSVRSLRLTGCFACSNAVQSININITVHLLIGVHVLHMQGFTYTACRASGKPLSCCKSRMLQAATGSSIVSPLS